MSILFVGKISLLYYHLINVDKSEEGLFGDMAGTDFLFRPYKVSTLNFVIAYVRNILEHVCKSGKMIK